MSHAETMLANFQALGAQISIKLHYLFCRLNHFPDNLGDMSEEQKERFRQDIKTMEESYEVNGILIIRWQTSAGV